MTKFRKIHCVNIELRAATKRRSTLVAMLASHTDPKDIAETTALIATTDAYIVELNANADRIVAKNLAGFRAQEKTIRERLRDPNLTDAERDDLTFDLETVSDRIIALSI